MKISVGETSLILVAMIEWLLLLMMIAEGSAGLTCFEYERKYFPVDKDKCRAPDINTVFNNGDNLMTRCDDDGRRRSVSIFLFGCNM